jgi:hypothetical protein
MGNWVRDDIYANVQTHMRGNEIENNNNHNNTNNMNNMEILKGGLGPGIEVQNSYTGFLWLSGVQLALG